MVEMEEAASKRPYHPLLFRGSEQVRLSMVGSHILKALLWYGRMLRDPDVDFSGILSVAHQMAQ
jgi:hypothetical protein